MASTAADSEIQDPLARLDVPGLDCRASCVQPTLVLVEPHATRRDGEITTLLTARHVPQIDRENPAHEESGPIGVEHRGAVVVSRHPEDGHSLHEVDHGDR